MFTVSEKELFTKYGFKYDPSNVHYFGGLQCPYEVKEPSSYLISKLRDGNFELEIITYKEVFDEDNSFHYKDFHSFKNFSLVELEEYFKEILNSYKLC